MALTYRTGSDGIGRALTINELDNNFRYFTGSHSITGSLEIEGNLLITGSIIPQVTTTSVGIHNLGSIDNPFKELFVSEDSINFVSGSSVSSFGIDSSGSLSGSFDGDLTGSFTGSIDSQYNSGSCLIGCTSSAIPTGARPEGTFEFVLTGGNPFIYVYIGGEWRSGSLA